MTTFPKSLLPLLLALPTLLPAQATARQIVSRDLRLAPAPGAFAVVLVGLQGAVVRTAPLLPPLLVAAEPIAIVPLAEEEVRVELPELPDLVYYAQEVRFDPDLQQITAEPPVGIHGLEVALAAQEDRPVTEPVVLPKPVPEPSVADLAGQLGYRLGRAYVDDRGDELAILDVEFRTAFAGYQWVGRPQVEVTDAGVEVYLALAIPVGEPAWLFVEALHRLQVAVPAHLPVQIHLGVAGDRGGASHFELVGGVAGR